MLTTTDPLLQPICDWWNFGGSLAMEVWPLVFVGTLCVYAISRF